MALFLTESVGVTPVLTLEEAHMGLIECISHLGELTEATLQADFIIHEQTRGLSESVILEQEEGFFTKVARHVVEAIKKVRDRVVGFFKAVGEHLKALWTKLTGRGGATISVPKGAVKGVAEAVNVLKALDGAVRANETDAKKYSAGVAKAKKAADAAIANVTKANTAAKASKSFETVSISTLNGVQAAANQIAAYAGSSNTDLAAAVKAAEKAANAATAGVKTADKAVTKAGADKEKAREAKADAKGANSDLKAAQNELARAKAAATAYTTLAATSGAVSSLIGGVVTARSTAKA